MQIEYCRNSVAWLTMVSLIMISGLRAQADDAKPVDGADKTPRDEVRKMKVEATPNAEVNKIEEQQSRVAGGPAASPNSARALTIVGGDVSITAGDGEERSDRRFRINLNAQPAGDVLTVRLADEVQAQPEELGKYWIGVQINEVSPALRAQLNLDDGRGVMIGDVLPESPANKAGVKQYDILLAIGDQKVGRNEDLLTAVKDADGKELELTVLRGGSERTRTVTPAERPKRDVVVRRPEGAQDLARWVENFQQFQNGVSGWNDPNVQFNVVKPGQAWVFPGHDWQIALPTAPLPEDLSISVTREGKQPAKITIKQKERVIETTEDKLEEVPEDLRRHVEPMLGRARADWKRQAKLSDVLIPAPPGQESPQKRIRALTPGTRPGGVEHRLEELERRFKELEHSLDNRDREGAKGDDSK
jgi:hypothetical protein